MESTRFDQMTKRFSTVISRRSLLALIGAGAATLAHQRALAARDATPTADLFTQDAHDPHPSADGSRAQPKFLFVQNFDNGTWAPKAGEDGVYTLTLTGTAANTIYFSDRPDRVTGLVPTQPGA